MRGVRGVRGMGTAHSTSWLGATTASLAMASVIRDRPAGNHIPGRRRSVSPSPRPAMPPPPCVDRDPPRKRGRG